MRNFFNLDNKILRIAGKVADVLLLEVMWFIASLPAVTLGAASRAFYDTLRLVVIKDEGSLFKTYWRSLKYKFLMTILTTLVYEIPLAVYISLVVWKAMKGIETPVLSIVLLIGLIFLIIWLGMFIVDTLILESSGLSFGKRFMVSYVFAFRKLLKTILLIAMLIVMVILVEKWIYFVMVFPALYMWLAQKLLEPVALEYADLLNRADYSD